MRRALHRWGLLDIEYGRYEPTTIGFVVFFAIGFAAILGFSLGLASLFGIVECQGIADGTGLSTSYSLRAGCFVEHDGVMIPLDRWLYLTTGGTP